MAASFTLHVLLLAGVLLASRARVIPSAPPPAIDLLDLSRRATALLDPQPGAPTCAVGKAYWGIGMQFDGDDVVVSAPQSYPAYQSGIRPGDILADPDLVPDAAGYDTVDFTRHGRPHRLRVKARWICLR